MSTATIEATNAFGTAWDPTNGQGGPGGPGASNGTLPDPICQYLTGVTLQKQTTALTDTLTPMWGAVISPGTTSAKTLMSMASRWSVKIVDDDGSSFGGFSSSEDICQVTPAPTDQDFAAGQLTFDNVGRCTHVALQLICAM